MSISLTMAAAVFRVKLAVARHQLFAGSPQTPLGLLLQRCSSHVRTQHAQAPDRGNTLRQYGIRPTQRAKKDGTIPASSSKHPPGSKMAYFLHDDRGGVCPSHAARMRAFPLLVLVGLLTNRAMPRRTVLVRAV
jgi:hypothetical protein